MAHELRSDDLAKPFFVYLPFQAGHAPHHAPKEWIDEYRGRFDAGWDAMREQVHLRQQEMGLVKRGSALSARDPDVPAWDESTDTEKRVYARLMEAFAGMRSHMDHHVGGLLDELEAMGELDNTIFLALSDNGASSEGGPAGAMNNQQWQGLLDQVPASTEDIERIGSRDAYNHFPWGWAWAGNTPFRRWKRENYRGGCAVPLVLAHGGRFGGYGFLFDAGRPRFIYSYHGIHQTSIDANDPVSAGRHIVRFVFEKTRTPDLAAGHGAAGVGSLYVDDQRVARQRSIQRRRR